MSLIERAFGNRERPRVWDHRGIEITTRRSLTSPTWVSIFRIEGRGYSAHGISAFLSEQMAIAMIERVLGPLPPS